MNVTRGLGALMLAGTVLLACVSAATAAQGDPLPTPTLHSATLDLTPPENAPNYLVGFVTLRFTAPSPARPGTTPPDYAVWADDRIVSMTSFPHNVNPENGVMTVEICPWGPGGSTVSCNLWRGDPPQPIPMTGRETFTITQQGPGGTPSAHSNGLVPTLVG